MHEERAMLSVKVSAAALRRYMACVFPEVVWVDLYPEAHAARSVGELNTVVGVLEQRLSLEVSCSPGPFRADFRPNALLLHVTGVPVPQGGCPLPPLFTTEVTIPPQAIYAPDSPLALRETRESILDEALRAASAQTTFYAGLVQSIKDGPQAQSDCFFPAGAL
jgi:hypothetical protein